MYYLHLQGRILSQATSKEQADSSTRSGSLFDLENGGNAFLRNVCKHLSYDTTSHSGICIREVSIVTILGWL
jgi:hypothetical protein